MKLRSIRSEVNKVNRTNRGSGISLHYQIKDFCHCCDTQKHVYCNIEYYNFVFFSVWVQNLVDHIKRSM